VTIENVGDVFWDTVYFTLATTRHVSLHYAVKY